MKKVLLFLVLMAGVGATGYLCVQSGETVSVWKDADYQQENAVEVQLVVEKETTTETTTEVITEAATEATTEAVQSSLPDYQDAIGTYVVTVPCALADTAGGDAAGRELGMNLVVAVTAQEDVSGTTWDQVEYYGMTGWMPDADLTRLGDGQKMQDSTAAWLFVEPGSTVTVYDENCTAEERAALTAGESTDTAVAETLSYGPELTVLEADEDWVKITVGETTGWIPAVSVALYFPNTYYYADVNINLRSGPAVDDEKVGSMTMGTTVIPEQIQGGWAKVEAGGVTGWAALYYMTPCEDSDGGSALAVTPTPVPTTAPAVQTTTSGNTAPASTAGTTSTSNQTTAAETATVTETTSSNTAAAATESTTDTDTDDSTDDTSDEDTDSTDDTSDEDTDSTDDTSDSSNDTIEEIPESDIGVDDVIEWE